MQWLRDDGQAVREESEVPGLDLAGSAPTTRYGYDMPALSLRITDAARRALLHFLTETKLERPVATIFQETDKQGRSLRWRVGVYARDRVASEEFLTFDGIEFYIEEDRWPELEGCTLDFRDGYFAVNRNDPD